MLLNAIRLANVLTVGGTLARWPPALASKREIESPFPPWSYDPERRSRVDRNGLVCAVEFISYRLDLGAGEKQSRSCHPGIVVVGNPKKPKANPFADKLTADPTGGNLHRVMFEKLVASDGLTTGNCLPKSTVDSI